jgi:rhamnose transport system ATP-binding protein
MDALEQTAVLALRGITKNFAGVQALRGVDFELRAGRVTALLGENGAGKSTLIKIIAGAHQPSAGEIELDGAIVTMRNPHSAMERGIAVVYQETSLAPDLSVLENLYLGSWKQKLTGIDWKSMREEASALFERLGIRIPLGAALGSLSKANAQQVEIARAILKSARILILDEPGSVLNEDELASLHALLLESKDKGVAVVYITHRLEEVFRIADDITVLRDGKSVASSLAADANEEWVVKQMVGRSVDALYSRTKVIPGEVALSVANLNKSGLIDDVSFELRAGEIVGLAGLVGAGRSEVAEVVAGLLAPDSGTVLIAGQSVAATPWGRQQAGVGHLPGDRGGQGVLAIRSVTSNITLTTLERFTRLGLIQRGAQRAAAMAAVDRFGIRPAEPSQAIGNLSGGNQQKALVARVLERSPSVIILEEPTSGVDIGAKEEIHHIIDELVAAGTAVLLISSDLPELVGMCDRVLVMREGRIAAEFARGATPEQVMAAAFKAEAD